MLSDKANTHKLADLGRSPVPPPPSAGADWHGVPHGRLVDALLAELRSRGYKPGRVRANLSRGDYDLTASIPVTIEGDLVLHLGVSVSNATRKQLRFFFGVVTPVGAAIVTAARQSGHRYTAGFDLAAEVSTAVDWWESHADDVVGLVTRLQKQPVSEIEGTQLLLEAGKQNLISASRLVRALMWFRDNGGGNAWGLLTAFGTEAALNPPSDVLENHAAFRGLVATTLPTTAPPRSARKTATA